MADPVVIETPSILIDGVEYECATRTANLIPTDKQADIETFCAPGAERPTSTMWTFDTEILISYGEDGTWNVLHAIRKLKKTVVLKPDDAAVSEDNPSATIQIYIPTIPFMSGKIGQSMPFTLTAKVLGDPVFSEGA